MIRFVIEAHMQKQRFFIFLVIFFLVSCESTNSGPTRPTKTAFKGMELYSWQGDDGGWSFAILTGTNRIKSGEEILANPLDIEEVKEGLCQLTVGEQVFWINWEISYTNGEGFELDKPPREIIDELINHAARCDVNLFESLEDGY